tara:strand:- start:3838 stop:5004 length:1167 start_codon:yes stop_codon:yes gene_type:complete
MNQSKLHTLGLDPERLARLGARIDADIEAGKYDGAAVHVRRRGKTVYDGVHGYADRDQGRALTPKDVFVSFSLGKQYSNVIVLNRIERGELHLSMQVGDLIPEFRDRGMREMTLFQLLTHTSGIMSAIPAVPVETLINTRALTEYIGSQRPEAVPGERVNYSIIAAHSVMAEMVKRAEGGSRSYAEILAADLFEPLGMKETSLGPRDDLKSRVCPVVARYEQPGMFAPHEVEGVGSVVLVDGCEIPAGGYLTTIHDVDRFTHMLANGGELDGVRILSPKTLAYCAQNFTGDKRNVLFDYAEDTRGWKPWRANIGIGFFVRGEGIQPGPMSNLSSPNTFCGWGAGSTCFWVDPGLELSFSFLSTGLMEETYHMERLQRLADIVVSAIID